MGGACSSRGGANVSDPSAPAGSGNNSKTGGPQAQRRELKSGEFGAQSFVFDNKNKIHDLYTFEKQQLGEGTYGSVTRGVHKITKQERAIKIIAKSEEQMQPERLEKFKREIDLMKECDHPNIVKLYETFEDARNFYLVMELCRGGELFDRIINAGHFLERECAYLMRQIFSIVLYLHESVGVMHRDIKPENFLLKEENTSDITQSNVKAIDFGLSVRFAKGEYKRTKAGTPYYVSPQVLVGRYTEACDVWSCGVLMYIMLCGYPPFHGDTDADTLKAVKKGSFTFLQQDWKNVTSDAMELITKCLKKDVHARFSARQALEHLWISEMAPKSLSISLSGNLVGPLKAFRSGNKLKKAALTVIATQITDDSVKQLRELFTQLDADNDGTLSVEEITEGMAQAGLQDSKQELEELLKQIDSDGSGKIDYSEFLAATMDKRHYAKESACYAAFRVFDRDGNGTIDQQELGDVLADGDLRSLISQDIVNSILADADKNGDGLIDFDEFMQMMQKDEGPAGGAGTGLALTQKTGSRN
mmetsp:Transcript_17101/g.42421  ORF Transcript_17101/g.42421 Transcript_17101/m.42421 type:complete len:532 (-) Transcript_17101:353-1948(-)